MSEHPSGPYTVIIERYEHLYRLRVGDWRIVYAVEDDRLIVLVIEISPRSQVYRDL